MTTDADPATTAEDVMRANPRWNAVLERIAAEARAAERQRCQARLRDLGYPDLAEWLAELRA